MADVVDPALLQRLRGIRGLPTLPMTCQRVLELAADPNATGKGIARVVEADPGLTTRVLGLVNSPFYGFARRVTNVSHAVAVMGLGALKHLVLSASVVKIFKGAHASPVGLDAAHFWEHSVACAIAARSLARRLKIADSDAFLTAGLLHDVGKLTEQLFFGEGFPDVLRRACTGKFFHEAEPEVYGFDHARLGAALLDLWRLPEILVRLVGSHHVPGTESSQPRGVAIVHVADILVIGAGIGDGGNRRVPPLDRVAWGHLGLAVADLDEALDAVDRDLDEVRKLVDEPAVA